MFLFCICDSWPQRRARNIWKPYQWKWITPPGRDLTERRDKQKLGFLKTVQLRTRDFLNIAQCTEEMNGEYSAQLASKLIYCEKKKHLDTKPKWKNGYTIWYDPQAVPKIYVRLWSCITLSGHLKLQRDRHTAERVGECSTNNEFSDRSPLNLTDL